MYTLLEVSKPKIALTQGGQLKYNDTFEEAGFLRQNRNCLTAVMSSLISFHQKVKIKGELAGRYS